MKKIIISLCVICMIFSQGMITFANANVEHESNDTLSKANSLSFTADGKYSEVLGVVAPYDTEDWFKIDAEKTGEGRFTLFHVEHANYDLYLYKKNGDLIASSLSTDHISGIDNVFIRANETYYIKVKYVSGGYPREPYYLFLMID